MTNVMLPRSIVAAGVHSRLEATPIAGIGAAVGSPLKGTNRMPLERMFIRLEPVFL